MGSGCLKYRHLWLPQQVDNLLLIGNLGLRMQERQQTAGSGADDALG